MQPQSDADEEQPDARIRALEAALEKSDAQLLAQVERAADTRDNLVRLKEALKRKRAEVADLKDENRQLKQMLYEQELEHNAFVQGLHEAYGKLIRAPLFHGRPDAPNVVNFLQESPLGKFDLPASFDEQGRPLNEHGEPISYTP